jgi:hypothetical protein
MMTPFELAISQWILTLGLTWSEFDDRALTEPQERALFRLVRGGFIEGRLRLSVRVDGLPGLVETTWRVSGDYSPVLYQQVKLVLSMHGYAGKRMTILPHQFDVVRLTSEGELAKQDFKGNHPFPKPKGATGLPKAIFNLVSGGPNGEGGSIARGVARNESITFPQVVGAASQWLAPSTRAAVEAWLLPFDPAEFRGWHVYLRNRYDKTQSLSVSGKYMTAIRSLDHVKQNFIDKEDQRSADGKAESPQWVMQSARLATMSACLTTRRRQTHR